MNGAGVSQQKKGKKRKQKEKKRTVKARDVIQVKGADIVMVELCRRGSIPARAWFPSNVGSYIGDGSGSCNQQGNQQLGRHGRLIGVATCGVRLNEKRPGHAPWKDVSRDTCLAQLEVPETGDAMNSPNLELSGGGKIESGG